MRRLVPAVLVAAALAVPAAAQTERPRISVVVVTLDQLRQGQAAYARSLLEGLGDPRWGRLDWVAPQLDPDLFRPCRDERPEGALDYCVRFYLTRAELPAEAAPTVVVAFDDRARNATPERAPGEMRVVCFGRGVPPLDADVQSTWLWPDAARMHGVNDLERDRDALAACVAAAAAEPFTGLRQPDPR